jgi:hypothetical protein
MARKNLAPIQHLVSAADPAIPTPSAGDEYFNSGSSIKRVHNGTAWLNSNEFVQVFSIQGTLSVGVTGRKQRIYNRSGSPWLVVGAQLYIDTAPTGTVVTLQVNKNGSLGFPLSVSAAGSHVGNSSPNLIVADGDYLDVDVTAVGSTVPGADATLTLAIAS